MKGKTLYIVSLIVVVLPWLFLLEIIPVPYYLISTAVEITIEAAMFAAVLAVVILLRRDLKSKSGVQSDRTYRILGRILFVLASITLFILGLILVLIAISFTI